MLVFLLILAYLDGLELNLMKWLSAWMKLSLVALSLVASSSQSPVSSLVTLPVVSLKPELVLMSSSVMSLIVSLKLMPTSLNLGGLPDR